MQTYKLHKIYCSNWIKLLVRAATLAASVISKYKQTDNFCLICALQ